MMLHVGVIPRVTTERMANKAQSYTVGRLLRVLEATQRAYHAGPLNLASITGVEKYIAAVASCSFGKNRVPETLFLCHFSTNFPLLQQQSWIHVHLTP